MVIAIVSDTHLPRGARRLPDRLLSEARRADLIVHAGDFVALSVLRELESLGEVIAVHGNVDEQAVRARLPETVSFEAEGARLGVIHDAGTAPGRLARMRARFPQHDAVVFGHSHMPLRERADDAFQIFNPGSPTERRRAPRRTMGIARVNAGKVCFELVTLG